MGEHAEKPDPHALLMEMYNGNLDNSLAISYNLKLPAIALVDVYPEDRYKSIYSSIIHNRKKKPGKYSNVCQLVNG